MTQRAVFRGFLVYLKRVLFACVLCWFGMIDDAIATGAGPINLDNDTYRLVTPAYTNTPDTGIYCTGSGCYFCDYNSYGYCGSQYEYNADYFLHPVPFGFATISHVTVPNNDSFMGWYETSTGFQCINAYGELTTRGMGRVYNYYGADMLGSLNPITWYAYYAPSGIKLVAPEATPGGRRGKEFLHWNDKKLYLNYNAVNGAFTYQMTMTTNCIPFDDLPQRSSYYFKGYYSQQTGGIEYVHYDPSLGAACLTQDGLNAVNSYTADSVFPKSWYAQWEPMMFNVTWNCNNGHDEQQASAEYQYGDDYSGSTLIPVGDTAQATDLECTTPDGYEFLGWYCSYTEAGEIELTIADSEFSPVTVGDRQVFWNETSGGDFTLPQHDVDCIAIWQQPYECPNNGIQVDNVLDQSAETELANKMLTDSGSLQTNCNGGESCDEFEDWGTVFMNAMCSSTASAPWSVGTPADDNGTNCWCQVRGYYPKGENYFIDLSAYMPWVFATVSDNCDTTSCAVECLKALSGLTGLHERMFTNTSCQYKVAYNCNGGGGNTPSDMNVAVGTEYEISSVSNCTAPNGQHIISSGNDIIGNGWICSADNTSNTYLNAINGIWSAYDNYTCTAQWENDTPASYTLTYVVTGLPNGATQPNNVSGLAPGSYTLDTITNIPIGQSCSAWTCETTVGNTSVPVTNNTITVSADTTCSSTCSANTINLIWDPVDADNPGDITPITTCEYGVATGSGSITGVQQPTRVGYTFTGWLVRDWDNTLLETFDVSSNGGNCYAYRQSTGACQGMYTGYAWCQSFTNQYCPNSGVQYASYAPGNWMVGFDYGAIRGEAVCATNSATQYATGSPDIDNNNGQYCWCRVNSFITKDSLIEEQYNLSWVYLEDIGGQGGSCKNSCARNCTLGAKQNATFRSALYGQ